MTKAQILDEVLGEIAALTIDEAIKERCLSAICAVGRRNGVKSVVVRERLAFAVDLLSKGESRSNVRKRLVHMHDISERQAIRVIAQALQTRHLRSESVAA
jgi:hypothetical protein